MVCIDKSCFSTFGVPDCEKKNIVLKINLKQVESTKYLGVIIDINLNWAEHTDYIYKKIIKFTSIFYKIRETFQMKSKRWFILPLFIQT